MFYCVAYKCIWLSYKCIYIKVHLMQPMHLWRHSQAPCSSLSLVIIIIIIIPPSLPLRSPSLRSPPFLPLERVSLSNSTDAHTWRDRMRHCLTQTDAHSWRREVLVFFFACACARSLPPTYDDIRTHIVVGIFPPRNSLQITVAHLCTCDSITAWRGVSLHI